MLSEQSYSVNALSAHALRNEAATRACLSFRRGFVGGAGPWTKTHGEARNAWLPVVFHGAFQRPY